MEKQKKAVAKLSKKARKNNISESDIDIEVLKRKKDKLTVWSLMTECLIEEYGEPPEDGTIDDLLNFYFDRPDSIIFILYYQKKFAGFIWLIESSDVITGKAFFCALYLAILPDYRSKGFARVLFNKAIDYSKEQGIPELRLTVRYNNEHALSLYQSLGFETYKHEMKMDLG